MNLNEQETQPDPQNMRSVPQGGAPHLTDAELREQQAGVRDGNQIDQRNRRRQTSRREVQQQQEFRDSDMDYDQNQSNRRDTRSRRNQRQDNRVQDDRHQDHNRRDSRDRRGGGSQHDQFQDEYYDNDGRRRPEKKGLLSRLTGLDLDDIGKDDQYHDSQYNERGEKKGLLSRVTGLDLDHDQRSHRDDRHYDDDRDYRDNRRGRDNFDQYEDDIEYSRGLDDSVGGLFGRNRNDRQRDSYRDDDYNEDRGLLGIGRNRNRSRNMRDRDRGFSRSRDRDQYQDDYNRFDDYDGDRYDSRGDYSRDRYRDQFSDEVDQFSLDRGRGRRRMGRSSRRGSESIFRDNNRYSRDQSYRDNDYLEPQGQYNNSVSPYPQYSQNHQQGYQGQGYLPQQGSLPYGQQPIHSMGIDPFHRQYTTPQSSYLQQSRPMGMPQYGSGYQAPQYQQASYPQMYTQPAQQYQQPMQPQQAQHSTQLLPQTSQYQQHQQQAQPQQQPLASHYVPVESQYGSPNTQSHLHQNQHQHRQLPAPRPAYQESGHFSQFAGESSPGFSLASESSTYQSPQTQMTSRYGGTSRYGSSQYPQAQLPSQTTNRYNSQMAQPGMPQSYGAAQPSYLNSYQPTPPPTQMPTIGSQSSRFYRGASSSSGLVNQSEAYLQGYNSAGGRGHSGSSHDNSRRVSEAFSSHMSYDAGQRQQDGYQSLYSGGRPDSAPVFIDSGFLNENPSSESILDLFNYLPDVVFFAKDKDSRFIAANEAMLQTKKLQDPRRLLGRTDYDFFPPALAAVHVEEDKQVMQNGQALTNKVWFKMDRTGRACWYCSSKTPFKNETGQIIGVFGVRHAIDNEEARHRYFGRINPAIRHLEMEYRNRPDEHHLAQMCGLSVEEFNREVNRVVGSSLNEFLELFQIEKARQLLACTAASYGEIAMQTGYRDEQDFSRHFEQFNGLNPHAYRERFRTQGDMPS